jgi:hypothetical protein
MDKTGKIVKCNRFKYLDTLDQITYNKIYDIFNKIIDFENDPNKWFYVCPIGWYLDSLDLPSMEYRIRQFKEVNHAFIYFFKSIQKIK